MSRVFHCKVVLFGDSSVGKTSIRRNYMGLSFDRDHVSTLGADFGLKKVEIMDDRLDLQIWDLGGQSGYEKLRSRYFSGSKGGLFVFDLTDKRTLGKLTKWFEELWSCIPDKHRVPVVILGNKCDLTDEIEVSKEEIISAIDKFKQEKEIFDLQYHYLETSAKNGKNITEAFDILTEQMYPRVLEDMGLESSSASNIIE